MLYLFFRLLWHWVKRISLSQLWKSQIFRRYHLSVNLQRVEKAAQGSSSKILAALESWKKYFKKYNHKGTFANYHSFKSKCNSWHFLGRSIPASDFFSNCVTSKKLLTLSFLDFLPSKVKKEMKISPGRSLELSSVLGQDQNYHGLVYFLLFQSTDDMTFRKN